VLHFTLDHIARIRPDPRVPPSDPMVFTVLNACATVEKGVEVVLGALERLAERGLADRFRLDVWGFVEPRARDALEAHPSVRLRGNYTDVDLERMLAGADVGIVPSVWEEAYAYTGVELLAAGVPVIGSALGGIPDYVKPGETGWLNGSVSGAELAEHMERLIGAPEEVAALRRRIREQRPAAVKPMERHLDELDGVYAELTAAR
jgi:glycosyltransferase involved in cell wall biosynthesis